LTKENPKDTNWQGKNAIKKNKGPTPLVQPMEMELETLLIHQMKLY